MTIDDLTPQEKEFYGKYKELSEKEQTLIRRFMVAFCDQDFKAKLRALASDGERLPPLDVIEPLLNEWEREK